MPELPEVEVVRRGLDARLTGQTILGVTIRQASLRWPVPADLPALLAGQDVISVTRRGKYLLIELAPGWLIVHLGMTGSLVWKTEGQDEGQSAFSNVRRMEQHDHVFFKLGSGLLTYNDPRRFGAILWHARNAGPVAGFGHFKALGVEPFSDDFTPEHLFRSTRQRKLGIKQLLLAGTVVVGVGNIYCSEALFRAGVRPTRRADRLTRKEAGLLHDEIRKTLSEAITKGGSTLKDFVNSEGHAGYFQLDYFAYGRDGQPCKVCATPIRQIRQQQRSSFFCPSCQR